MISSRLIAGLIAPLLLIAAQAHAQGAIGSALGAPAHAADDSARIQALENDLRQREQEVTQLREYSAQLFNQRGLNLIAGASRAATALAFRRIPSRSAPRTFSE